jgi:hypothetical protein
LDEAMQLKNSGMQFAHGKGLREELKRIKPHVRVGDFIASFCNVFDAQM